MSSRNLVLIVCAAQIAAQLGAYVWSALLPELKEAWDIGPAEAGLITSSFYLAYIIAAPILVSLTDRIDPKRIYIIGAAAIAAGPQEYASHNCVARVHSFIPNHHGSIRHPHLGHGTRGFSLSRGGGQPHHCTSALDLRASD